MNNFPNFFDIENFTQSDTRRTFDNWNPLGSGEWTVEAKVTHVCYSDYRCVGNPDEEPICGAGITGKDFVKRSKFCHYMSILACHSDNMRKAVL